MIGFDGFFRDTATLPLARYHTRLQQMLTRQFQGRLHGEFKRWDASYQQLPAASTALADFAGDSIRIGDARELDDRQSRELRAHLQLLQPWRKGPWELFGIAIEAEWRANLKWERLRPHLTSLRDRLVLDVGCGNAYYGFRMLPQQPRYVLGIDPSQQFLMQFRTIKKYAPPVPLAVLPLRDEHLPARMPVFDSVFSMGVLYHRREPMQHLNRLRNCLRPGGELILESLVIEGGPDAVLRPGGRYAAMNNVYAIPSSACLSAWLEQAGFINVRLVDETPTTSHEQRRTGWMTYQSLADFLDPDDAARTIEGHPAPVRALFIANA